MNRSRILITSGPTREHLDPVRYLSNASSGQMGCCLAVAALENGFDVTIVSGPVAIDYPADADVINVVSTDEMLEAVKEHWPRCVGLIAAAAPSDFRPANFSSTKIKKSADSKTMSLELIENPDILAEAGKCKTDKQWTIGFALETDNGHANAVSKLERKNCDYIVLNAPSAIDSADNSISIIDPTGKSVETFAGPKQLVANRIIALIAR